MSKIFMIGDTHAGMSPLNYHKWMLNLKEYFYKLYIPLLKERYEPGDICIHLGDLFDNRNQIPIDVLNDIQKIVEEISSILPIYILIGNHDIFTKSSNDINTPRLYKHIPDVFIIESTKEIEYNNKKLLLMPWVDKKSEQIKLINQYKSDYLFCHSDLNGAKMHLNSVAHKNLDKIDVDEFKSYKYVFSGHIHINQVNKNFIFNGSIYQMDRNDFGNKKGVYILDTNTDTYEFIENNISPEFRQVVINSEDDIKKLENIDTSRNYVDLKISNNLLVNSRKTRRNLELLLEKGSFSDIEYINDIKGEEVMNEEVMNIDLDKVKIDNYEELLVSYIDSQNYENGKIKDGIKEELFKIFDLYKKN